MSKRMRWRAVVPAALVLLAIVVAAIPAGAISPVPRNCTASGRVDVTDGDPIDIWEIAGVGSCAGGGGGPWLVAIEGEGTSEGLGLCDGSVIVRDLNIVVDVTLVSVSTGNVRNYSEEWFLQVTTFPIVTPFLVATENGKLGAGFMSTRLGGRCDGNPGAKFVWTETT